MVDIIEKCYDAVHNAVDSDVDNIVIVAYAVQYGPLAGESPSDFDVREITCIRASRRDLIQLKTNLPRGYTRVSAREASKNTKQTKQHKTGRAVSSNAEVSGSQGNHGDGDCDDIPGEGEYDEVDDDNDDDDDDDHLDDDHNMNVDEDEHDAKELEIELQRIMSEHDGGHLDGIDDINDIAQLENNDIQELDAAVQHEGHDDSCEDCDDLWEDADAINGDGGTGSQDCTGSCARAHDATALLDKWKISAMCGSRCLQSWWKVRSESLPRGGDDISLVSVSDLHVVVNDHCFVWGHSRCISNVLFWLWNR